MRVEYRIGVGFTNRCAPPLAWLLLTLATACGGDDVGPAGDSPAGDAGSATGMVTTPPSSDSSVGAPSGGGGNTPPSTPGLDASAAPHKPDPAPPATDSGAGGSASDAGAAPAGDDAGISDADVPDAGPKGSGTCCADGDCYCRGDAPTKSSSDPGPYKVQNYVIARSSEHGGGTVYYPADAEPPFAGAVICPPLTGVQAMYKDWGPFLASWGIVLVTMDTKTTQDSVQSRGVQLAAMVKQFRAEKDREGGPLKGKLGDRIGTMGWSMGGGATWIAAAKDATLKSSISLAGHNATGGGANNSKGTMVPSMQLNGATDTSILGGLGQSDGVYAIIPETTPKLIYVVNDKGHFEWGGPKTAGATAGEFVLSFQKTFLEGDTRWKQFLLTKPANASTYKTNIK